MLDRVRQALLDEPVRSEVDAGWELRRLAFDPELDGQPRLPRLRDEPVQVLKARLRRQRRSFLRPAQDADQSAHLGQRLAAGLLDDLERLSLLLLIRVQPSPHRARLDGHHAHAVPDDVVQLARDPGALLGDGSPSLCLLFALESVSPLLCGRRLLELRPMANPASQEMLNSRTTPAIVAPRPESDR